MQKVSLSKPFSFEGKEYAELNLDFDGLTGRDIIDAILAIAGLIAAHFNNTIGKMFWSKKQ